MKTLLKQAYIYLFGSFSTGIVTSLKIQIFWVYDQKQKVQTVELKQ